jgi:hypothetical protein
VLDFKEMKKILFVLIFNGLLWGCVKDEDEEITARNYPRVRTQAVSGITSEGAIFQGEIFSVGGDVLDHGFIWSTLTSQTINNSDRISLGATSTTGMFEVTIERSLQQGLKYYVNAYAVSKDNTVVYGDLVEFESLGSNGPVISSIVPKQAKWSDTLTVTGKNFSNVAFNNKVTIESVAAQIVYSADDTIKVVVPWPLMPKEYHVSVENVGNIATSKDVFSLIQNAPEIVTVSPDTAFVSATATITGYNFNPSLTVVKLNDVQIPNPVVTGKTIRFPIPLGLPSDAPLTLQIAVVDKTVSISWFKAAHKIRRVEPLSAFHEDEISIYGDYFPKNVKDLQVRFGNYEATVTYAEKNKVKVQVPEYCPANPTIQVTVDNVVRRYDGFTISPPQITSIEPAKHLFPGDDVTVSGMGFRHAYVKINGKDYSSYTYNRTHTSFKFTVPQTAKESMMTVERDGLVGTAPYAMNLALSYKNYNGQLYYYSGAGFVFGSKVYYGFGQDNGIVKHHVEYDAIANTWDSFEPSNVPARHSPVHFSIGNFGYVGGGRNRSGKLSDFFKFDPSTRTWTSLSSLPSAGDFIGSFTENDRAYCLLYSTEGGISHTRVYQYEPSLDKWTRLQNFSGTPRYYISGSDPVSVKFFSTNGKHYMVGGKASDKTTLNELWEYDVSTDQWNQLSFTIDLYEHAILTARGRIFLVNTKDDDEQEWYEFSNSTFTYLYTKKKFIWNSKLVKEVDGTSLILGSQVLEFDPNY